MKIPNCFILCMGILWLMSPVMGCATPDGILEKIDYTTSSEKASNIEDLMEIALDGSEDPEFRCYALKAIGSIREGDADALGKMLSKETNEEVTAWGAWAVGKIKNLESIKWLVKILEKTTSRKVGYYAIEALARMLPSILLDPDLNYSVMLSLNKFAAHNKENLPYVFELLFNKIKNLKLLTRVLDTEIRASREKKTRGNFSEDTVKVYAAVFQLFRFLEMNLETFISDFPSKKEKLRLALEKEFRALDIKANSLKLLIKWYVGVLSNNAEFSSITARRITSLGWEDREFLKLITLWTMSRMKLYSVEAKTSLQKIVLKENQKNIINILGDISSSAEGPDEIQKLYNIEPAK